MNRQEIEHVIKGMAILALILAAMHPAWPWM